MTNGDWKRPICAAQMIRMVVRMPAGFAVSWKRQGSFDSAAERPRSG